MADYSDKWTDKELLKLEKRIAGLYKQAEEELETTIADYFDSFARRDEEMKKLIGTIQNGREWTEADYKQWRLNQIGRGKRFEALRDEMAARYTDANAMAVAYANDATPGIYSLNRNYAAYTIDKGTGGALTMPEGKVDASWTLFDESTVRRLAMEQPDLMPHYPKSKALKRGIDLAYGKRQITATVASAILQGKSIGGIADILQTRITDMNRNSAIRAARTSVTGAQNAGRMDTYRAAEKMGIKLQKEWLATLDNRTRHAHALLDGQKRPTDKPFEVDGDEIMFPGDPSAKGYLVYNCRCTLVAALDGVDTPDAKRRAKDPKTGKYVLIKDITYQEWAGMQNNSSTNGLQSDRRQGMINSPIERNGAKGRPSAIDILGAAINSRQKRLLDVLPDYDSRAIVKKNQVSMKDLAALTAHTGVEFAMFTKGGERMILRGSPNDCNIGQEEAVELRRQGYKWSGHTHPGNGALIRMPSKGDAYILSCFRQLYSAIYDSRGMFTVFGGEEYV